MGGQQFAAVVYGEALLSIVFLTISVGVTQQQDGGGAFRADLAYMGIRDLHLTIPLIPVRFIQPVSFFPGGYAGEDAVPIPGQLIPFPVPEEFSVVGDNGAVFLHIPALSQEVIPVFPDGTGIIGIFFSGIDGHILASGGLHDMVAVPVKDFLQSSFAGFDIGSHIFRKHPEFCIEFHALVLSGGVGIGEGLTDAVAAGFQRAIAVCPADLPGNGLVGGDGVGFPGGNL